MLLLKGIGAQELTPNFSDMGEIFVSYTFAFSPAFEQYSLALPSIDELNSPGMGVKAGNVGLTMSMDNSKEVA